MRASKWIYYLFKDNKRFWICFNFYVGCCLIPLFESKYGGVIKKLLGDKIVCNYCLWCLDVQIKTMKFKLKSGDLK